MIGKTGFLAVIAALALEVGALEAQVVVAGHQDPAIGCRGFAFSFSGSGDMLKGYPTVTEVLPNSPGAQAGLVAGDKLVAVDGTNLVALFAEVAAGHSAPNLWRHAPGTEVKLTIEHDGKLQEAALILGKLEDGPPVAGRPRQCVATAATK